MNKNSAASASARMVKSIDGTGRAVEAKVANESAARQNSAIDPAAAMSPIQDALYDVQARISLVWQLADEIRQRTAPVSMELPVDASVPPIPQSACAVEGQLTSMSQQLAYLSAHLRETIDSLRI